MAQQSSDYSTAARGSGSQALLDSDSYVVRDCTPCRHLGVMEHRRPLLDDRRPGGPFHLAGLVVRLLYSESSAVRAAERARGIAGSSGPPMDQTESVPSDS